MNLLLFYGQIKLTITTLSLRYVIKNVHIIYELNSCLFPGQLISFKSTPGPYGWKQIHGMIISVNTDIDEIKILWA